MSPELDKQLCEKYPLIFAQRNRSPQETAMCWGFECGDGWYDLLNILCINIQTHCEYNPDISQVVAMQVKEKYGTLRFYAHGGDEYISGVISMAELMSCRICESCGNKGTKRHGDWVRTRCNSCERVEDVGQD
jgi:hypothetical protein